MKRIIFLSIATIFCFTMSAEKLQSPNGEITLLFALNNKGQPEYSLAYKTQKL
jgi:hypothetical protein